MKGPGLVVCLPVLFHEQGSSQQNKSRRAERASILQAIRFSTRKLALNALELALNLWIRRHRSQLLVKFIVAILRGLLDLVREPFEQAQLLVGGQLPEAALNLIRNRFAHQLLLQIEAHS